MRNKIPKILAFVYIFFISFLALDSESIFGLLIHLLPSIVFIGILVFAWIKPKIGGLLFMVAGLGTVVVFNTYREFLSFVGISVIPVLIGFLFWFSKKK